MKPFVSLSLVAVVALAALSPVTTGADPPASWHIDDPTGDQTLGLEFSDGGAPMPANGVFAHSDLTKVTIEGETALGLYLVYHVAGLKVQPAERGGFSIQCSNFGGSSSSGMDAVSNMQESVFQARFELAGTPFYYTVGTSVYGTWLGMDAAKVFVATSAYSYLCLETSDENARGAIVQPVDSSMDEATSTIRLWIPKTSLLGIGESPFRFSFGGNDELPRPKALLPGDRLTKFEFETVDLVTVPLLLLTAPGAEVHDTAPNGQTAPDFSFAHAAANQNIALSIGDEQGILSVAAGSNQSVGFTIENKAATKRLVKLSYSLEGAKASGYKVFGPPSVTIPGGETRNFTLAFDVPATAVPGDDVALILQGDAVGNLGDVAYARATVLPVPTLGPGANTLYLHSRPTPSSTDVFQMGVCAAIPAACAENFLSPIEKDPLAGDPDRTYMFVLPTNVGGDMDALFLGAPQQGSSPVALAFDTTQPIKIDVRLKPRGETSIRLTAFIDYYAPGLGDGAVLAEATETATIGAAGGTISLTAPPQLPAGTILPPGTSFLLNLQATLATSPGAVVTATPGGLEVEGAATRFSLPLVELPPELRLGATPNPFQVGVVGDRAEFVNPGEGRLFNVTLLNQAAVDHDAHVVLDVKPDGWMAKVLPGDAFRLKPGDSIRLGVLLVAPAGAKEGEEGSVWANVTSADAKAVGVRLSTLVVTGVDLPDDSLVTASDADAREKLIAPGSKGTPAPGLFAILLTLGLLFLGRRRT